MRLHVRGGKLRVGAQLREFLERRAGFALAKFGPRVGTVSVTLKDVNGPKGGVDQRCLVTVELVPSGIVRVEQTEADLTSSIARAMERAGRSVGRTLERRRDGRLSGPGMGLADDGRHSANNEP